MSSINFSSERKPLTAFSQAGLADIVFLLLIFFMITSTFIKVERKLDLELPEAKAAEVEQKERKPIQIEMDRGGRITLDGQLVTMKALETRLKEFQGKRKSAVVRADRRLKHGTVTAVLGLCRDAGIREIAIAVK